jgi:hypothetical protein
MSDRPTSEEEDKARRMTAIVRSLHSLDSSDLPVYCKIKILSIFYITNSCLSLPCRVRSCK